MSATVFRKTAKAILITLVLMALPLCGVLKYISQVKYSWNHPVQTLTFPTFSAKIEVAVECPEPIIYDSCSDANGGIIEELLPQNTVVTIVLGNHAGETAIKYFVKGKSGYICINRYVPRLISYGSKIRSIRIVPDSNTIEIVYGKSYLKVFFGIIFLAFILLYIEVILLLLFPLASSGIFKC